MSRQIVTTPEKAPSVKRELSVKHYSSPDGSPLKKAAKKNVVAVVDLEVWQAVGLSSRNVSGAWTELWGSFVFKFVLHAAVLLSVELECGEAPPPVLKTWWGGGGVAVAECEPQYTFPVVLATVFLLIVWLAFGTGAHLNPSVTAGSVAAGALPLVDGAVRIAAQASHRHQIEPPAEKQTSTNRTAHSEPAPKPPLASPHLATQPWRDTGEIPTTVCSTLRSARVLHPHRPFTAHPPHAHRMPTAHPPHAHHTPSAHPPHAHRTPSAHPSHEELDTHHKIPRRPQTVDAPCGRGPTSLCRTSRPRGAAESAS